MVRLALLLSLTLAACAVRGDTPPSLPMAEEVRPTAKHDLQGHWRITSVNGRPESGLWLELGGEGLATITRTENAVFVGSPQPRTRTHLGCNYWYPSGWTRESGNLIFGREMSRRTEIGCDEAREALDDEAYAIVTKPMTMEFTSPYRLRLVNESGTLELVRTMTRAAATAFIESSVRPGTSLGDAINHLVVGGFACRRLGRHEYGPAGPDGLEPEESKMVSCHVAAEHTPEGYQLVYASLSADQQERLVSVQAGSYPVIYRNLRVDNHGRLIVVPDRSH